MCYSTVHIVLYTQIDFVFAVLSPYNLRIFNMGTDRAMFCSADEMIRFFILPKMTFRFFFYIIQFSKTFLFICTMHQRNVRSNIFFSRQWCRWEFNKNPLLYLYSSLFISCILFSFSQFQFQFQFQYNFIWLFCDFNFFLFSFRDKSLYTFSLTFKLMKKKSRILYQIIAITKRIIIIISLFVCTFFIFCSLHGSVTMAIAFV